MSTEYDPRSISTPVHDIADVRARLARLLGDVDHLAQHLANPPEVPDLTDYEAPLTYGGHRYRVTGSALKTDGSVTLHLEPDSGRERRPPKR